MQVLEVSDTDFSAAQCFAERGFATCWRQGAAVCIVGWFASPKVDRSKWTIFVEDVRRHKPFWVVTRSTRCDLTPADLRPLFDLPDVTQTDVDLCEYGFAARGSCKIVTNMHELRGLRARCTPERPHQHSRADHARAICSWPTAWMDMFAMLMARACGLPPRACRRPLAEVKVLQACHVYVGRGCRHRKLEASEWSNPFRITGETSRAECVDKFSRHLQKSPEMLKKLHTLRGCTLLCHCPRHLPCHADVLCAMTNGEKGAAVEAQDEGVLFSKFFDMVATDRKRPHGQAVQATVVRAAAGRWAAAAGTQLKRTTMPPIIQQELEPGEAVQLLTNIAHPFNVAPRLDDSLQEALVFSCRDVRTVKEERAAILEYWCQRAEQLRAQSVAEIAEVPDVHTRRLLLKTHEGPPQIGSFTHVALWRELHAAAASPDSDFVESLKMGFPIVGKIQRSHVWPEITGALPPVHDAFLFDSRAWEVQRRVEDKVRRSARGVHAETLWRDMIADRDLGYAVGPFHSASEVTAAVGSDKWFPTPRFPLEQGTKIRGIDDASAAGSEVNLAASATEKLQVPSTDTNIAMLRSLKGCGAREVGGWVVDEAKAYRQLAVKAEHRRYSVVALWDPQGERVAYFMMVGHSFGLVAAVYNYNRRATLVSAILLRVFKVATASYYDDRYGFSQLELIESEREIVTTVYRLLGIDFSLHKLQSGQELVILGIVYDLKAGRLGIKPERREKLLKNLEAVLQSNELAPARRRRSRGN